MRILTLRIFWTCSLIENGTGYFYHNWSNWATGFSTDVFAGYNRKALNRKSTTFQVAISQFKEQ